jgi:hypothetical protein
MPVWRKRHVSINMAVRKPASGFPAMLHWPSGLANGVIDASRGQV